MTLSSVTTMASADFSTFVVTTSSQAILQPRTLWRPHGISHHSFLVYPPDLHLGLHCLFGFHCFLPACPPYAPTIRFLSVGPRFRYCFFSPTPRDVKLASRYRVRRQLRPLGFSPKNDDMPVIQIKGNQSHWFPYRSASLAIKFLNCAYLIFTVIAFGWTSGILGIKILKTPFENSALIFSSSTPSGSLKLLSNL